MRILPSSSSVFFSLSSSVFLCLPLLLLLLSSFFHFFPLLLSLLSLFSPLCSSYFNFSFFSFPAKYPGQVLVKSARGINRAPAIWIAHLISTEKIPLRKAYEIMKACHSSTKLNAGFFEQLMALEKEVLSVKENSMNLTDYRKSSVKKWF